MPDSMITKRALAGAMKELMGKHPLAKITVGDICGQCGMSRKGFYYHFKDKYDLVNWVFYIDFMMRASSRPYDSTWDFFEDICTYFYENRRFYINAFSVEGQNSFSEYFSEILRPLVFEYLNDSFAGIRASGFYAGFFTDAFRLSIVRWLHDEAQLKPREFVALLRGAVVGVPQKTIEEEQGVRPV